MVLFCQKNGQSRPNVFLEVEKVLHSVIYHHRPVTLMFSTWESENTSSNIVNSLKVLCWMQWGTKSHILNLAVLFSCTLFFFGTVQLCHHHGHLGLSSPSRSILSLILKSWYPAVVAFIMFFFFIPSFISSVVPQPAEQAVKVLSPLFSCEVGCERGGSYRKKVWSVSDLGAAIWKWHLTIRSGSDSVLLCGRTAPTRGRCCAIIDYYSSLCFLVNRL